MSESCGNPAADSEALMPRKQMYDKSRMCVKCKEAEGNIVIRHAVYCKACFTPLIEVKFRRTFEPHINRIPDGPRKSALRPAGDLLLGYSGGLGSTVLLDLMHRRYLSKTPSSAKESGGKAHPRNERVWTNIRVCYVETCDAFSGMRDRTEEVRSAVNQYEGFEFIPLRIQDAFDRTWWGSVTGQPIPPDLDVDIDIGDENLCASSSSTDASPLSRLQTYLRLLPTPTAVAASITTLTRLLLLYTAYSTGTSHLALGTSLTSLSIALISSISQGGGFTVPQEAQEEWTPFHSKPISFDTPWAGDVRIVRPLREIGMKECAAWAWWHGLNVVGKERLPAMRQTIGGLTKGTNAAGTRVNGKQRAVQQQDAINVDGSVRDEDVFTLGDDDDEDDEDMHRIRGGISSEVERVSPPRSTPPPAYSAEPCPPHNEALPSSVLAESGQAEEARTSADAPADQAVENQSIPSKYYVKPGDTLTGIALRFGVDGRSLCRLNKLPPSTLSTTPHLLHTRTYLTLPPSTKVRSTLVEPIFDAEEEERRAEARNLERAQKRFQFVTKEVDWRVAKTYVALAETEGDDHRQKEGSSKEGEGTKALAAGGSSARGREEAAVDRYLDDDEWEARERREGRGIKIPTLLGPNRIRKAGQDATEMFYGLHRHEVLERPQYARLVVGVIGEEHNVIHDRVNGVLSDVPYAEPSWLSKGFTSPYFKESHKSLQKITRAFVDTVVYLDAQAREEDGKWPSRHVIQKMGELNLTAMRLGPGKHLEGLVLADRVVTPEEYDYFHEVVIHQEFARVGARGYSDGLGGGVLIGLPPVILFGRPDVKQHVVPQVLSGEKHICLAITEAFAGSDVSGMRTTAKKTVDGKYWIINGTKKWITNGAFSDYFTLGCKTDAGFTVILVERGEGVETKPIKTAYSSAAGTA
ncbi:hypothetical protein EWM64_g1175 [Hericium alpestre]|uniref:LysM domain-containing protein n=1 Tax=Hericium alpestre TaxID=135208 RepID=A0A4Z0A927_9AGAM|nr:hypothetical protein EWM64_g1175 [Hericium alpestre]